ncbi:ATP-binding protein [Streptomyces sp. NPDC004685]
MEAATPSPAARAPVALKAWWLMPLALGAGTVANAIAGPDTLQIPATFAGAAATAASTVCVRLLVRSQDRLRRTTTDFHAAQAEYRQQLSHHGKQWEQHVAGQEEKFKAAYSGLETQLAEHSASFEAQRSEDAKAYEVQLAAAAGDWREQLARQQAAVAQLAVTHLPGALERLRAGDAIDDILPDATEDLDATPELAAELRKVLRTALIGMEEELDRSTSAEQAVISIGSRIHVLTSMLRGRLHEMQGEHGRLPAVARGLMELDQGLGPADCLAASIGVLGGSDRPGRQWQEPQKLLSVVRGGIGRIKDFDRVEVRQLPELGVDGGLVDHLTLILAQLLDNAARYSPPAEPVVVSGKEVPNGVGIEIQDVGKGLSEEKKLEAEQALSGSAPGPGLGGISEDASLGLRVVGRLARRYGIRVTFADSPWLGTSVVVVVPHKYFSPLPAAVPEPAAAAAAAAPGAEPAPVVASSETAGAADTTPGGLPRRRSRREGVSAQPERAERTEEAVAVVPPVASFDGLAAFATAGRRSDPPRETTADSDAAGSGASAGREFNRTEESD